MTISSGSLNLLTLMENSLSIMGFIAIDTNTQDIVNSRHVLDFFKP